MLESPPARSDEEKERVFILESREFEKKLEEK